MMRRFFIVLLLALFTGVLPLVAQDVVCTREAVITSYAVATDISAWVQEHSACPSQIRRAVRDMAAAYQMLGSEYLPFAAADDPFTFSPIWKFYQGSSTSMVHLIDTATNTLSLLADTLTDQRDTTTTAPILAYPVTGDVMAQVKLTFTPLGDKDGAALGIRAAQNPNNWIRIQRSGMTVDVVADTKGTTSVINSLPFEGEQDVYLKIERVGAQFTLSYSVNGDDWREVTSDQNQVFPQEIEVYLTTFWPVTPGAGQAIFSDMKVSEGG